MKNKNYHTVAVPKSIKKIVGKRHDRLIPGLVSIQDWGHSINSVFVGGRVPKFIRKIVGKRHDRLIPDVVSIQDWGHSLNSVFVGGGYYNPLEK